MTQTQTDIDDAADDREQLHETTGPRVQEHADDVEPDTDADAIVDAIEAVDTLGDERHPSDLWTTDMWLPSFGDMLDSCGEDIEQICCDCGHVSVTGQTCNQSTCPRCWKNWDRLYTRKLMHKMEQTRRIRADNRVKHQRWHHVSISPPADWEPDSDEEWKELLDVVEDIADSADLEGFAFYHPYSGKFEDDLGEWKGRLGQDTNWDDVQDELKMRPHVHLIVCGHKVPGGAVTRAVESETGWVINRITKADTNVSLYGPHDLARAVSYCLSHVGLYKPSENWQSAVRGIGDKLSQPNPKVQIYDWDDAADTESDVTEAQAREDQKLLEQCDAIVRRVAPKTLDLSYDDTACQADLSVREIQESANHQRDRKVDVAYAEASRSDSFGTSSASASSSSSSSSANGDDFDLDSLRGGDGSWSDVDESVVAKYGDEDDIETLLRHRDDLDRADLEALVETETQTCEGRTVVIAQAPRYLNDPEWVTEAQFADEARDAFIEWAESSDWGPDPDVLDDPPPE